MLKIRKNDIVVVSAGRDKGKKARVLAVLPERNRAVVENVNFVKRHTRKTREDQQGGIIQKETPIHISNLMLFCSKCNSGRRVGFGVLKDGSKTRICRSCREVIA